MPEPIWARESLRCIDYRLIWWMIDAGVLKGELARGWIQEAASDLKVHRTTVHRRLRGMEKAEVLKCVGTGFYVINSDSFESGIDEARVRNRRKP
jgi:DNA-binding transcriptional regulator YhcF (GntR family)